jgi:FtsH ternary system-associated peptide
VSVGPGGPATGIWSPNAAQTALQVMRWAADPAGPPPRGSLQASVRLVRDITLRGALQELARATAARLGAGRPALGDPGSVGPGGILLAAALGGRERTAEAARLAALVPAPALGRSAITGWLDALARHAVVGAAVTEDDPVSRACLDASPLSNVLVHPAEGQSERAVDTAVGLLGRPRGPGVLTAVLSAPAAGPRVLGWRARLLSRLARSHSSAVAGVYAAALLQHGTEWRQQLRSAALALETSVRAGRADPWAVATVEYWSALNVRQVAELASTERLSDDYEDIRTLAGRYGLDVTRAG